MENTYCDFCKEKKINENEDENRALAIRIHGWLITCDTCQSELACCNDCRCFTTSRTVETELRMKNYISCCPRCLHLPPKKPRKPRVIKRNLK